MINTLQQSQINEALYEIHRDISAPLTAKRLASIASYSEQHFHRVFKKVVGETVNVYIRRIRLEHAANQLMFDQQGSVLTVAAKCGFISLSSFNKAFKKQFSLTPGEWRHIAGKQSGSPYLSDPEIKAGYHRIASCKLPEPEIVNLVDSHVAYVRHQGYGRSIRTAWLLLTSWATEQGIVFEGNKLLKEKDRILRDNDSSLLSKQIVGQQIGLHHSNPAWVELSQCRYVACVTIDKPLTQRGVVNQLTIPGGLHAAFNFTGQYGELLPWISRVLDGWLPSSGYKLQTTPAFVHYRKNQFLSSDDLFDVTVFLPLSVL
ncbi:MAG: AraC family transcriptional regulator [Cellvibrionaceae bacterium]